MKSGDTKKEKGVEYSKHVVKLCRLGATNKEIADFFGISVAILNTWKRISEFLESLEEGEDAADTQITDRFFKRATRT